MFSQAFFLVVAMLISSSGIEPVWHPNNPYAWVLIAWILTLGIIALQNKLAGHSMFRNQHLYLVAASIELIIFLGIVFFLLLPPYSTQLVPTLIGLTLYGTGLGLFHFTSLPNVDLKERSLNAYDQLKFLIPFTLPFLALTLVIDQEEWVGSFAANIVVIAILIGSICILPILIQKLWDCTPLEEGALKERLDALAARAHFKHGGMKIWTIMKRSYTAAIIGVVPSFRYVMFTRRLLDTLTPEEVEAVLAHEIGHSKRGHLFLFPYILMGMLLFSLLLFSFLSLETVDRFFTNSFGIYKDLAEFTVYIIFTGLYFRFLFGYFSRLFERQADLYVLKVGIPPEEMAKALDRIGHAAGGIHNRPSWHHWGIGERIAFMEKVAKNHSLSDAHDARVKRSLGIYTIFLIIGFILIWRLYDISQ